MTCINVAMGNYKHKLFNYYLIINIRLVHVYTNMYNITEEMSVSYIV